MQAKLSNRGHSLQAELHGRGHVMWVEFHGQVCFFLFLVRSVPFPLFVIFVHVRLLFELEGASVIFSSSMSGYPFSFSQSPVLRRRS